MQQKHTSIKHIGWIDWLTIGFELKPEPSVNNRMENNTLIGHLLEIKQFLTTSSMSKKHRRISSICSNTSRISLGICWNSSIIGRKSSAPKSYWHPRYPPIVTGTHPRHPLLTARGHWHPLRKAHPQAGRYAKSIKWIDNSHNYQKISRTSMGTP